MSKRQRTVEDLEGNPAVLRNSGDACLPRPAGLPFEIFRTQRQPMSIAHNKGETPLFASGIERFAKRNQQPPRAALGRTEVTMSELAYEHGITGLLLVDPYNDFISKEARSGRASRPSPKQTTASRRWSKSSSQRDR